MGDGEIGKRLARPGMKQLERNCVQIWRIDLTDGQDRRWLDSAWALLRPDEVDRARRIRAVVAREEFVAGRAALRCLLGREIGCEPQAVALGVGRHGKPELADRALGIEFNVAHSKGFVLIALSRAGEVGVDIEQKNAAIEALELARDTFHADDLTCIEQAAEAERAEMFFRCWTRKEAVLKADGRGLTLPLRSFSAGIIASAFEEFAVGGYLFNNVSYFVHNLDTAPGFAAALAVATPEACLLIHDFRDCDHFCNTRSISGHHPAGISYTG